MSPEIVPVLTELGVSAFALYAFYKIIENMMTSHRKDREEDSQRWRDELKLGRQTTEKALSSTETAIRELTTVIRNRNDKH